MKILLSLSIFLSAIIRLLAQEIPHTKNLSEVSKEKLGISYYYLEMGTNTYGDPMKIPVIVVNGKEDGPTLGLTAAIHGDELNGIPIIHQLIESIDSENLKGRVIAIPGLNAFSIHNDTRRFIDEEDLNRNFPGKKDGNRSQQYAYKIAERVLPAFDFLVDMHTASFGRVNTLYVRAELANDTLRAMAEHQSADIILNSLGVPSVGMASQTSRTMRAEAMLMGIPSITIEYGNPQVFQNDMTERGLQGIQKTMNWLGMYPFDIVDEAQIVTTICKKSYWLYMEEGGFLTIHLDLNQKLIKDQKIATVRNAFGQIINEYVAPEAGIVIGKSTNPANMSGGRLIHLGILED
jgi:uncharacterized protein